MKNICIIGASSGLGLRLTVDYLGNGQHVFGTFFSDPRALIGLQRKYENLVFQHLTLKRPTEFVCSFSTCDCLIVCAGEIQNQLLIKENLDGFQHQIEANLTAPFQICQTMYKTLRKSENGHVVFITSGSAIYGNTGQAAYSAAKAGIIGLGKSLAKEWARSHIKVNIVSPGYLRSRQTLRDDQYLSEKYNSMNSLGRTNTLKELSGFIRHLTTTRNISGQVFQLDSRMN